MPTNKKPRHKLQSLTVNEVSLVDVPANRSCNADKSKCTSHAVVALWKRDTTPSQRPIAKPHTINRSKPQENIRMSASPTLEQILKHERGIVVSRAAIEAAVKTKAVNISKRLGVSLTAAENRIWSQNNSEAQVAYEALPIPRVNPNPERTVVSVTKAEISINRAALRYAEEQGITFHKAYEILALSDK